MANMIKVGSRVINLDNVAFTADETAWNFDVPPQENGNRVLEPCFRVYFNAISGEYSHSTTFFGAEAEALRSWLGEVSIDVMAVFATKQSVNEGAVSLKDFDS